MYQNKYYPQIYIPKTILLYSIYTIHTEAITVNKIVIHFVNLILRPNPNGDNNKTGL